MLVQYLIIGRPSYMYLFGQFSLEFTFCWIAALSPNRSSIRLLSIPQAQKRLPGFQTSILNCSKTLLPLLPIQINLKSCINLLVTLKILNYASVGIFMITLLWSEMAHGFLHVHVVHMICSL